MEALLTACIPLLLLAALLRGLKHPFYALHLLLTASLCWLAQHAAPLAFELFSPAAITIALLAHLLSINIITFAAYAYDKRASRNDSWRIPERALHAFALIGGTPAAWLAQHTLRHKTRKHSFQIMFWAIFILQLLGLLGISVFG